MAGKRTTADKSEKTAALLNATGEKAAKVRAGTDPEAGTGVEKANSRAGMDPEAGAGAETENSLSGNGSAASRSVGSVEMDVKAVTEAVSGSVPEKKAKVSRIRAKEPVPEEMDRETSAESIFRKLIEFGKQFNVDNDNDFREAVRNYAEESALIIKMRNQVDQDGLTTWKSYKTGDQMVAHPLIQEISRHVDCANRTLAVISDILKNRGAKREDTGEDLDKFRVMAHG